MKASKRDNDDLDSNADMLQTEHSPFSGYILRESRESRQWSVEYIASHLKIRVSQVIAMEEGNWVKICPDAAFAHSYLRNYIQLLGLPVDETLKKYGALTDQPIIIQSVNSIGVTLSVPRKHWHLPKAWRWLIMIAVAAVILWQLFDQWAVSAWLSEMLQ